MNIRNISILSAAIFLLPLTNAAFAETGKCYKAKDMVVAKNWETVRSIYRDDYIEKNKTEFENAINKTGEIYFNDCQSTNLSDEQIVLQGALDYAALPVKVVFDQYLQKIGLPATGDKAFHIDVKDIDKYGIFGGPNSVFRKPFG